MIIWSWFVEKIILYYINKKIKQLKQTCKLLCGYNSNHKQATINIGKRINRALTCILVYLFINGKSKCRNLIAKLTRFDWEFMINLKTKETEIERVW